MFGTPIKETVSIDDGPYGGWQRVDTSGWIMDNVNDLHDPYGQEITDVLQWEGERNDAPIKPLMVVEKRGEYWGLYRPNWFSNKLELVDGGPYTMDTKEEAIKVALKWQKTHPVETAPDPLNPPIEE